MKEKGKGSVDQPKVISVYNKGMDGLDLLDMLLGSYRPNLRSKKWWWPLFSNAFLRANHEAERVRLGGPTASVPGQIRLDGVNYTLVPTSQGHCIYCKSSTRLKCSKCDKRLHKKVCHEMYHSK